jgi:hypothetical protein
MVLLPFSRVVRLVCCSSDQQFVNTRLQGLPLDKCLTVTYTDAMKKKQGNSPLTSIRLDKDDEQELKFVQEQLSAPGLRVSKSEALRRALYGFANLLRSQDRDRRGDGQNGTSKSS